MCRSVITALILLICLGCDKIDSTKWFSSNNKGNFSIYGVKALEVSDVETLRDIQELYETRPDLVFKCDYRNTVFFVVLFKGVYHGWGNISILLKDGRSYIKSFSFDRLKDMYSDSIFGTITSWKIREINDIVYLFFLTEDWGNRTGHARFNCISVIKGDYYYITIEGGRENCELYEPISKALKHNPDVFKYLQYEIAESEIVNHLERIRDIDIWRKEQGFR
jgi:hypothetical protein